jgi:HAD superfamily hydrolase (TIGR01549 family)
MDSAIIFDVDGVLLDLTHDEEEVFFQALAAYVPTHHLSRDWNSYQIRNDEDIIMEILERYGQPSALKQEVVGHYLTTLEQALTENLQSVAVAGAADMLNALKGQVRLGIATANLLTAAKLRLQQTGLWSHVAAYAQGADGGGHKHEILARLLQRLPLPPSRVVYVGDNVNDVVAGQRNGVRFIGFSTDPQRRVALSNAGAQFVTGNHMETLAYIELLLA